MPTQLSQSLKEPMGQILVRKGIIDDNTLENALDIQSQLPEKKIGEILLESEMAGSGDIASALMEQKSPKKYTPTQVKVNTAKLDDLVDYAGELVIAQSMLKQQALRDPSLRQSISQLEQIISNIQRIAMSMRMIPIHSTFMKMIPLIKIVNLGVCELGILFDKTFLQAFFKYSLSIQPLSIILNFDDNAAPLVVCP